VSIQQQCSSSASLISPNRLSRYKRYSCGEVLLSFSKILVRATNWIGDAVMSLPALRAVRDRFPAAEIVVLAKPWVADLYSRESFANRVIPYERSWQLIRRLRTERFDGAILFQNAFEAALVARAAGIPKRIGYDRDGRGWLLTTAVPVPQSDEIPPHQRFYYLELLRRAGILRQLPACDAIRLDGAAAALEAGLGRFEQLGIPSPVIGISPGAAYGNAKRWPGDRFADAARRVAQSESASIALFGSREEHALCESVAQLIRSDGILVHNFAGQTSLREFIDLAAACRLFLTNDSGAMHIASALGVPTVAIFGATDDAATGPTGPLARVVREPVDCSPCLLRECPIDHRCMTRVSPERVAVEGMALL
jgi:heptosyltransferase-2